MIRWFKKLGLNALLEEKKMMLSSLRHEAFYATRDGDLCKVELLSKKADKLEDEIIKMIEGKESTG